MDLCSRCGTFVCLQCVTSVAATVLCGPCAARAREVPNELPPPVIRTLVVAASGFVFPPFGLAGALLAAWQLRRLAHGHPPPRVEEYLRIAVRVGLLGAVISTCVWLTWGSRLLLRALQ